MLYLFDSRLRLVAEDDNGGRGLNSRLSGLRLPAGHYYVGVTTYPCRPHLTVRDELICFRNDGRSSIAFDLIVELE
jgi:hypothetical protein